MLEKGTYLIYFEIEWDNFKFSSSKKIKMNFYSEFNCQIKIMSNSIDFRKNLLSNIFGNISNIQKTKQTSKINNFIKKLSDNIHLIYGVFLNYYYLIVKNSILLKQCYKLKLEIALKGSFYTDLTLQTKDFSDKEIKLFLPSNKDLILIFKITELIDINPKIIKALKLTEKIKTSAQNYELLPFSFQLIKPNNNSLNNYDSKNKLFDKPPRELGPLIKELGKLNKRIVNEQEIEVGAWILTFEEGIAILIENYMENHIYFEKIYHKTQNLEIVIEKNQKRVKYFKNYLEVRLEPFKYALMKWKQKNNINIYSYNFKSIFFIDNFSYKSKFSF